MTKGNLGLLRFSTVKLSWKPKKCLQNIMLCVKICAVFFLLRVLGPWHDHHCFWFESDKGQWNSPDQRKKMEIDKTLTIIYIYISLISAWINLIVSPTKWKQCEH